MSMSPSSSPDRLNTSAITFNDLCVCYWTPETYCSEALPQPYCTSQFCVTKMPDRDQSNPNTNLAKSLVCFRHVGAESCLSDLRSVRSHFSAHNGIWSGRAFFPFSKIQRGTAIHMCSPGTQEAEAGILLQLRSLKQSEDFGGEDRGVATTVTFDYFFPPLSSWWTYLILHLSLAGQPLHIPWLLLD